MSLKPSDFEQLAADLAGQSLCALADADPGRTRHFVHELNGLRADFSRQKLDAASLSALVSAAEGAGFDAWRKRFFAGDAVNATEARPALHMAWRAREEDGYAALGEPVGKAVAAERARIKALAREIRKGVRTGATGRPIRHILHLGIGGSDLGPRLIHEALKAHRDPQMTLRFAANIDPAELNDALEGLDPETTLVIAVSKSFTTQETMANAAHAKAWLAQHLQSEDAVKHHLAAVTAAPDKAVGFGVSRDLIFGFQDWVGGRYSLWSSVALSLEIALEDGAMDALRDGARAMDAHFRDAPAAQNLPLLKALIDFFNLAGLGYPTRCIVPYSTRLKLLPNFLQQLEMESNGKSVTPDGEANSFPRAVVWGAEGANAQHAFFQQLHQGPQGTPVDFIAVKESLEARPGMHAALLANCIAQGEALMRGRTAEEAADEMRAAGLSEDEAARLAPHRVCPGNRPSTTIVLDRLDPYRLGLLLALYEHKTATEGALTAVNSFDQFGVELGKTLATRTLPALEGGETGGLDAISAALIEYLRR